MYIHDRMKSYLSTTLIVWLLVVRKVSSFSSRTKNFVPIIACKSTSEVCKAIDVYVKSDDRVLELGAQLSDISTHICQAVGPAGNAVLVDVKRKEATSGRSPGRDTTLFLGNTPPESENNKSANFVDRVEYHELDQFDQWRELTKDKQSYKVLVLDVGSMIGGDLYLSALSLAYEFIGNQQHLPRAIIVKSKVLNNLSRRIVHSQRLLDGTITLPKKDELDKFPSPIIVPCVGVNDYRKTIPILLEQGDEVIEIGSHYGSTTTILHDAVKTEETGFCVGVDIGEKIIMAAKKRYPHVQFEVADAWDTLKLLKLKHHHGASLGYDAVYADIGGLSGAHGLLESLALIDAIGRALEPRMIVIKSLCMKRLAKQLIPCSSVKRRSLQRAE